MGRLDGRAALVTGGASGIGLETVRRFSEEGASVAICDIADDRGEAAAAELRAAGKHVIFVHHDAGDPDEWDRSLAETAATFGKLDILVNNAYSGGVHAIATASFDELLASFRVTANGVFLGMTRARDVLSEGGAIVNIGSIAAHRGAPSNAVYGAAKNAVLSLSRSAAVDFARRRIRVNVVTPGIVHTPALISTVQTLYSAATDEEIAAGLKRLASGVPLRRVAEPSEIANAVLFLASDEASFITGAELAVDGGSLVA